ncbi:MAG: ribulose-phosphate 3-epimerase [Terriglobales bacterium]
MSPASAPRRAAPPRRPSAASARPVIWTPSILAADFGRLAEQVAAAEAGGAARFQVDIMDGAFVPNISMGPMFVGALRRLTTKPIEAHLMTARPQDWIVAAAQEGADWIIVHAESTPHLHRMLETVVEAGARPAVALNPDTPLVVLEECLPTVGAVAGAAVGMVLLMTVNPGFGGQRFIPAVLDKVARLRHIVAARGLDCDIEIDGGVEPETILAARRAGANNFVAGSAVFGHPQGPAAGLAALRRSLQRA